MRKPFLLTIFRVAFVVLAVVLAQCGSLWAQENAFTAALNATTPASLEPVTPVRPSSSFVTVPRETPRSHRFWDNQNRVLFLSVAAFAAGDFYVTHANLAGGGRELNPVTRVLSGSTPGLAANFALETGGVMSVSYLFHRSGHHRLERMTSVVNIAGSGAAIGYGLSHR